MNNIKDNEKLTITITGPRGIGKTVLGAYLNWRLFNDEATIKYPYNKISKIPLSSFSGCFITENEFTDNFDNFLKNKGIKEVVINEDYVAESGKEQYDRLHPDTTIDNEYKHMEEFIVSRGWDCKKLMDSPRMYMKKIDCSGCLGIYKMIVSTLEEAYLKELKGEV